ncbi:MAG: hypothetical protein KDB27_25520 [Planctomycetales bacterium]|nr:hypothetical protein [Planctomycetales bacterium]
MNVLRVRRANAEHGAQRFTSDNRQFYKKTPTGYSRDSYEGGRLPGGVQKASARQGHGCLDETWLEHETNTLTRLSPVVFKVRFTIKRALVFSTE